MNNSKSLLHKIEPELVQAFSEVPEYGTLGITVYLHQKEPVRVEWSGSITRKLDKQEGNL